MTMTIANPSRDYGRPAYEGSCILTLSVLAAEHKPRYPSGMSYRFPEWHSSKQLIR